MNDFPVSESVYRISQAREHLKKMTREEKLDLMEKAGLMTPEQIQKAKDQFKELNDVR